MTVRGIKDTHYICDLKMESEIACAHNVVIRGPQLTIDKAGVVSPTLVYDFPAGAGLVAQGLGWKGNYLGTFPVDCDITSPYFVTPSGLKVKKDTFNIYIDEAEPDGWGGNQDGIKGATLAQGIAGNLVLRHTHPVGTQRYLVVSMQSGSFNYNGGGTGSLALKVVAPSGAVTYQTSTQVYLNAPGQWAVYPLAVPRQTQSGIANNTWWGRMTTIGGTLLLNYGDAVIQGSGIHYLGSHFITLTGTGAGNPFSVNKDMLISYRLAGGVIPDTTRSGSVGQVNFVGSSTRFGLLGINMSGYRPSSSSSYTQLTINTFADNTQMIGATVIAAAGGA